MRPGTVNTTVKASRARSALLLSPCADGRVRIRPCTIAFSTAGAQALLRAESSSRASPCSASWTATIESQEAECFDRVRSDVLV